MKILMAEFGVYTDIYCKILSVSYIHNKSHNKIEGNYLVISLILRIRQSIKLQVDFY